MLGALARLKQVLFLWWTGRGNPRTRWRMARHSNGLVVCFFVGNPKGLNIDIHTYMYMIIWLYMYTIWGWFMTSHPETWHTWRWLRGGLKWGLRMYFGISWVLGHVFCVLILCVYVMYIIWEWWSTLLSLNVANGTPCHSKWKAPE